MEITGKVCRTWLETFNYILHHLHSRFLTFFYSRHRFKGSGKNEVRNVNIVLTSGKSTRKRLLSSKYYVHWNVHLNQSPNQVICGQIWQSHNKVWKTPQSISLQGISMAIPGHPVQNDHKQTNLWKYLSIIMQKQWEQCHRETMLTNQSW